MMDVCSLHLSCRQCSTTLGYTQNYALIQCPKCSLIIDTRDPLGVHARPPAPQQPQTQHQPSNTTTNTTAVASNGAAASTPKPVGTGADGSSSSAGLNAASAAAAAINSGAVAVDYKSPPVSNPQSAASTDGDDASENRLARVIDEQRAKRQSESMNSADTELQPMKVVGSATAPPITKPKDKPTGGGAFTFRFTFRSCDVRLY